MASYRKTLLCHFYTRIRVILGLLLTENVNRWLNANRICKDTSDISQEPVNYLCISVLKVHQMIENTLPATHVLRAPPLKILISYFCSSFWVHETPNGSADTLKMVKTPLVVCFPFAMFYIPFFMCYTYIIRTFSTHNGFKGIAGIMSSHELVMVVRKDGIVYIEQIVLKFWIFLELKWSMCLLSFNDGIFQFNFERKMEKIYPD